MSMMIKTDSIPKPNGKEVVLNYDGDTQDIVDGIIKWDGRDDKAFCEFAKQFERSREGMRALWEFVKYKIKYKEDGDGGQVIQSPRALWSRGVGDCKSKTIFVNQVLRLLGIEYIIRFVSYSQNRPYTHVYSIACVDGQQIIMDTVWHYFDSEKPYSHKKDYSSKMVKITAISGIGTASEAQKKLREIREKQSYVPSEEFIPFSRLTTGAANAMILRRRLQIKEAMIPEQSKALKEGLKILDSQILSMLRGKMSRGISGVGSISDAAQPIARLLTQYMQQDYPAAYSKRKDYAGVGNSTDTIYTAQDGKTYKFASDPANTVNCKLRISPSLGEVPSIFIQNGKYIYASNSEYVKSSGDTVKIMGPNGQTIDSPFMVEIWKLVKKYLQGIPGIPPMCAPTTGIMPQVCVPVSPLFTVRYMPPQSGYISMPMIDQIIQTGNLYNSGLAELVFRHNDFRNNFMQDLRIVSGIPDAYLNDIFRDHANGGLGNGVMYAFCRDAKRNNGQSYNLADYPAQVVAKYATHAGYVSGCAQFVGMDSTIIKNLCRQNVNFNQDGKDPDFQLKTLLQNTQPRVGVAPIAAVVAAIVAIINALAGAAAGIMNAVKNKGESIEPTGLPDTFRPIGQALQFEGDDWAAGAPGGGSGSGGGSGDDEGGESKLPLLFGAAALGFAFYEYNKQKS